MAPGREQAGCPAASGASAKPGVEEPNVPESWVLEPDLREQTERIDRLAADSEPPPTGCLWKASLWEQVVEV
jgi:hypothetical protein